MKLIELMHKLAGQQKQTNCETFSHYCWFHTSCIANDWWNCSGQNACTNPASSFFYMLCHSEGEYNNVHTEHNLGIRLSIIIVMFMLQCEAENSFQLYMWTSHGVSLYYRCYSCNLEELVGSEKWKLIICLYIVGNYSILIHAIVLQFYILYW